MTLEKTLRWIVLGGIFTLPFIVFIISQSLFFPFITGKNFTFRIIVEIITGAWLALAIINPAYRPRRSWLLAAFSIFVVIIALADAFGVSAFKSFWSNFERMDGWVTLIHLYLYFTVASTMLSSEKLWRTFFHISLVTSALVGAHALLQLFGIASLNQGFSSVARLDATFGNPIYLASYMLFNIFIGALLLARLWRADGARIRMTPAVLYGSVIFLDTLILFLTGTRGAMLGIAAGATLAALLLIFNMRDSKRGRTIAISVVAVIFVFAGGLFLVRDQQWVQSAPVFGRLATISISEKTAQARLMNWGTAWQGVKERPLLGWGQENFAIVFNKYYNPQMYSHEQWFDRVHNIIFDWLIAGGFLGLLAYLSLFVISLFYIWRKAEGVSAFTTLEQSILTGLLAAYFFHNLFVFDNIMSYFLFVSVLAFIAFRAGEHTSARKLFPSARVAARAFPIVAIAAVVLVWGSAWYVNAHAYAANKLLLKALVPSQEGLDKNLEFFEQAINYNSAGTQEAREQLIQATGQIARVEGISIALKQEFFQSAVREMSLQADRSPLDPRFPLFLGSLLNSYGFSEEAAPVLARARELAPTKQTILFEVAANAFARGDTETSLSIFKEAFELAPESTEARIYYAAAAIRAGEDALADEILDPIVDSGVAADPRIAAAYISRGRYDKIITLWEALLYAYPENIETRFILSEAYYQDGNSEKAIELLQYAKQRDASITERANALIEEIRSGSIPR